MKKNEIFTFTAPNGVEVTAVVIDIVKSETFRIPTSSATTITYLCYAQNRLFYYMVTEETTKHLKEGVDESWEEGLYYDNVPLEYIRNVIEITEHTRILVDYCILPDYDAMLEDYQHKNV